MAAHCSTQLHLIDTCTFVNIPKIQKTHPFSNIPFMFHIREYDLMDLSGQYLKSACME